MVAVGNRQRVTAIVHEIIDTSVEIEPPERVFLRIVKLLFPISEVAGLENEDDLMHLIFLYVDDNLRGTLEFPNRS